MKKKLYAYMVGLAFVFFYLSSMGQHFGSPGKQTPVYKDWNNGIPYGYYEYLPQNFDVNPSTTKKYPVVIFFGGVGQLGNGTTDLTKLLGTTCPPKLINNGKHFPAIVISAQHSGWFDPPQAKQLYDYIMQRYPADSNRIYLTGLSAGGASTWKFADAYPELLAAIVPIAGATEYKSPKTHIQEVSIWAFHNVGDGWNGGVPSVWSMINADKVANLPVSSRTAYPNGWGFKRSCGYDVTIHLKDKNSWVSTSGSVEPLEKLAVTMYNKTGHSGWAETYNNQKMWDWMFAQSKSPISIPNELIVDAGNDVHINLPNNGLILSGSASSLIGTTIASQYWSKASGPSVSMSGIVTPNLSLSNLQPGTYEFVFSAVDLNAVTGADTVKVYVNQAPIASAGLDQFVNLPQDSTFLDGSGSYDPEGKSLTYSWKLINKDLVADTDTVYTKPSPVSDYKVFINFTPSWLKAGAPWNNMDGGINAGTKLLNMVDDSNRQTGIDLELVVGWNGSKRGGAVTGNNSGVYADKIIDGVYWFQNRTPQIKLSGLDTSNTYTLKFLASRSGWGNNKTTVFSVGSVKDSAEANNNTNDLAVLTNLTANSNGELLIDVNTGVGSTYGYLNAIELEAAPKQKSNASPVIKQLITTPTLMDSTGVYVNFTPSNMQVSGKWNNTDGNTYKGNKITSLLDENGKSTPIEIEFLTTWNGSKLGGETTGNNSGVFEDDVLNGFYWLNNNEQRLLIKGLNPSVSYNFSFIGSRTGWVNNKTTVFSIGSEKDSINASQNTSNTADLSNVTPNSKGEIVVRIYNGKGATYGYLNAMVIKAITQGSGVVIPNPNAMICAVKNLNKGEFKFELTVADDKGILSKDTVVVNVGSGSTSRLKANVEIIEEKRTADFRLYPNPAVSNVTVVLSGIDNPVVEIYNLQGKTFKVPMYNAEEGFRMNVEELPTGIYLLRISEGEYSSVERLVIAPR